MQIETDRDFDTEHLTFRVVLSRKDLMDLPARLHDRLGAESMRRLSLGGFLHQMAAVADFLEDRNQEKVPIPPTGQEYDL